MSDSKNHGKKPPFVAKRYVETYSTSNTAARDSRKGSTKQHKQYKPVDQPFKLKGKAKEQGD